MRPVLNSASRVLRASEYDRCTVFLMGARRRGSARSRSFQKPLGSMFHCGGLSSLRMEGCSSGVASRVQFAIVCTVWKYSFRAGAFSWCHVVRRKGGGVGARVCRNSKLRFQFVCVSVEA